MAQNPSQMLQQSIKRKPSSQFVLEKICIVREKYKLLSQVCHWNRFRVFDGSPRPVPGAQGGEGQWVHEGQGQSCSAGDLDDDDDDHDDNHDNHDDVDVDDER